jgi:hypothetical protein
MSRAPSLAAAATPNRFAALAGGAVGAAASAVGGSGVVLSNFVFAWSLSEVAIGPLLLCSVPTLNLRNDLVPGLKVSWRTPGDRIPTATIWPSSYIELDAKLEVKLDIVLSTIRVSGVDVLSTSSWHSAGF